MTMQNINGNLFEHAVALQVIEYFERLGGGASLSHITKNCTTFHNHATLFALQNKKEQQKFLKQAYCMVETLMSIDEFQEKKYSTPIRLEMLGAAHGKKGNTTDVEVHFDDGQRLNISCKHRSQENKAPRVRHNRFEKILHITGFEFLNAQGSNWSHHSTAVRFWLLQNRGIEFEKLSDKWKCYEMAIDAIEKDCKSALLSKNNKHNSTQKKLLKNMLEFLIGTHSYFLFKKINEYEGAVQKIDVQSLVNQINKDQVFLKKIEAYSKTEDGTQNLNPSKANNRIKFIFSNGFGIDMRIKNGNSKASASALKFSIELVEADKLSEQHMVQFHQTSA